ncbi:long-chain acyl-CoA synthetase [Saccharopolyspora antimicrobica]|uniref:Long-chain acyl-CoA synthetase n=1 Tax=Saccharopolyspora antimicrobica TaxID=455193 RepID=A0A1I5FFN5_9PSEU|nr:AMP-binding protein [Saccharopolyspora antimicrobica]RKT82124.1 long-chain acyl-CoA synthetase [Saccharopolyspora antimicrobica]SFO22565.1 long-chain acyl-CoA synthetase [Saccharopolyspora antimicrobica]
MSSYAQRPWLAHYGNLPADIEPEHGTVLDLFRAAVSRAPETAAIRYFDGELTVAEVDAASDALAVALQDNGFQQGDRLGVYVQNDPAFVVAVVAAWKAGGAAVVINPMNKARELSYLLADSGATALLCLDELHDSVAREVLASGATQVSTVITCSAQDWRSGAVPRAGGETLDLLEIVERNAGREPVADPPSPDDVAVLTYTSGTTGEPKGAMNTHAVIAFNAQAFRDWMGLTPADSVLGVAPLFHITGLVGHFALSLLVPCPLVLAHRFQPEVVLEAIRRHRPTFTIGAITAFIALAAVEGVSPADFRSFRLIYSGGAPVPPAVNQQFLERTGHYIHNAYGLTETTSITHLVPPGARAPVDPTSGALSIGLPIFNTVVRILDDEGAEAPVGQVGEIAIAGPQVVPGYWGKPEATAAALPNGELRTGDVGFMDADGWFYVVDRKKDLINAAGYKVWPREVEDVLYEHPAVLEAAVVGVPDPYRGETVKAFVALKPGASATTEDLLAHCKDQLAAYKYPRRIELLPELPKTPTGKILRRTLRDR